MKFITAVHIAKISTLLLATESIVKIIIYLGNPVSLIDHINIGNSIFQFLGFSGLYTFFIVWHKKLKE